MEWLETYLLANNLPPNSCDGEPAPTLVPLGVVADVPSPFAPEKGERTEWADGASMGDVLAVEGPDRVWPELNCGR